MKTRVPEKNLSEQGREPTTNQDILIAFRKWRKRRIFSICPREMFKFKFKFVYLTHYKIGKMRVKKIYITEKVVRKP